MIKDKYHRLQKNHIIAVASLLLLIMASAGMWWWIRATSVVSTDDARVKGTIVTTSAKLTGRIKQVLVAEGDTVEAGQQLAELENDEAAVQVAQAQANLTAAKAKLAALRAGNRPQEIAQAGAGLAQAQANLNNAIKKYERATELYKQGALSTQQKDAEQTAFNVTKAQYEAALQAYGLTSEGSRLGISCKTKLC